MYADFVFCSRLRLSVADKSLLTDWLTDLLTYLPTSHANLTIYTLSQSPINVSLRDSVVYLTDLNFSAVSVRVTNYDDPSSRLLRNFMSSASHVALCSMAVKQWQLAAERAAIRCRIIAGRTMKAKSSVDRGNAHGIVCGPARSFRNSCQSEQSSDNLILDGEAEGFRRRCHGLARINNCVLCVTRYLLADVQDARTHTHTHSHPNPPTHVPRSPLTIARSYRIVWRACELVVV